MCVQWNTRYTSDHAASLVSLVAEPGNIECEDQSPRESGTAMAVPAVPVAPGLDRSYICMETSSLTMLQYCGVSVVHVHVIPKLKGAH